MKLIFPLKILSENPALAKKVINFIFLIDNQRFHSVSNVGYL